MSIRTSAQLQTRAETQSGTHVWNEVKEGVAGERADGERHEILEERAVEDAAHDGDDGDGAEPDQTDDAHR